MMKCEKCGTEFVANENTTVRPRIPCKPCGGGVTVYKCPNCGTLHYPPHPTAPEEKE